MQFAKNTSKISENKQKQGRSRTRYYKRFGQQKTLNKGMRAADWSMHAWRERDHCGWTGSLAKPRRPV